LNNTEVNGVNLAAILGDEEADPEGLVWAKGSVGRGTAPTGEGFGGARPLPR